MCWFCLWLWIWPRTRARGTGSGNFGFAQILLIFCWHSVLIAAHRIQCFPQVENKALTKLAKGQHACHRRTLLGREYDRGPPSCRGFGGSPPKIFFEILHAIWWHLVTSEAIWWSWKVNVSWGLRVVKTGCIIFDKCMAVIVNTETTFFSSHVLTDSVTSFLLWSQTKKLVLCFFLLVAGWLHSSSGCLSLVFCAFYFFFLFWWFITVHWSSFKELIYLHLCGSGPLHDETKIWRCNPNHRQSISPAFHKSLAKYDDYFTEGSCSHCQNFQSGNQTAFGNVNVATFMTSKALEIMKKRKPYKNTLFVNQY